MGEHREGQAMIYIVEIVGPSGDRARKEYESTSMRAALRLAQLELQDYPNCEIVDIKLRPDFDNQMDSDAW
jgi:hypothetical protein